MWQVKWYRHDPGIALDDMMPLSLEERGAYCTVLDLICHKGGQILDDKRFIAGYLRCDIRIWNRIRAKLIEEQKIYVHEDVYLRSPQADKAVDESKRRLACAQEAATASIAKRRNSCGKNNGLSATFTQLSLEPSTITPTLTSTFKKDINREGYNVFHYLDGNAISQAELYSQGWDIEHLGHIYSSSVRDGKFEVPKNAKLAFPAWVKKYAENRSPPPRRG